MIKSAVKFSANTFALCRGNVCNILQVTEGVDNDTYLKLPMMVGRKKKEVFPT